MRTLLSAIAVCLSVAAARADDAACIKAPTRGCIFEMAGAAIKSAPVQPGPPQYSQSWGAVINGAARAGQLDLALSLAAGLDKQVWFIELPDVALAARAAKRDADFAKLIAALKKDPNAYAYRIAPLIVAEGPPGALEAYAASLGRVYKPASFAAFLADGHLLAGRKAEALKALEALSGEDRADAISQVIAYLRYARRMELAPPLLPLLDPKSGWYGVSCAAIAIELKDGAQAEKCMEGIKAGMIANPRGPKPPDGLPLYRGDLADIAAAFAAAGDWQRVQALTANMTTHYAIVVYPEIAQYASKPEFLPAAKAALDGDSKDFPRVARGESLVRMMVMAGKGDEAVAFIAKAPDQATRDVWSRRQVEALAETGKTGEGLAIALKISDPVQRAAALAAVADNMKG